MCRLQRMDQSLNFILMNFFQGMNLVLVKA